MRADSFLIEGRVAAGVKIALLLGTLGALGACSESRIDRPEAIDTARGQIIGGVNDNDTEVNNVVVQIISDAGGCSGMLITPQIVLTAAHCVVGVTQTGRGCNAPASGASNGVIELGPAIAWEPASNRLPLHTGFPQTVAKAPACGTPDATYKEQDIALLFLQTPLSPVNFNALSGARAVAMPRIVRPQFPQFDNPVTLAIAGYSALWPDGGVPGPGITQRQVATASWTLTGSLWTTASTTVLTADGDSGGPLFQQLVPGSRQPIGVHTSSHVSGVNAKYADITRGDNNAWILDHVRHGGEGVPVPLRRLPHWFETHPSKNPNDYWIGELDYSGPCPTDGSDIDCDGWYNDNDNCPLTPNSDQLEDENGNGVPCHLCTSDPLGDVDYDSVCGSVDNCVDVFNPYQDNCNFEFEQASIARGTPVEIRGDACDPVPCPLAEGVNTVTPPIDSCFDGPWVGRVIRDRIDVHPVGPHSVDAGALDAGAKNPTVPLDDVPTFGRFCQNESGGNERCKRASVLMDSQLRKNTSAAAVTFLNPNFPWYRVTLKQSGSSNWRSPDDNIGFKLRYADDSELTLDWDYRADNLFWHRENLDTIESFDLSCDNNLFPRYDAGLEDAGYSKVLRSCLNGRFWLHAETKVGDTVQSVGTKYVGAHGANLANYAFDVQPDAVSHVNGCLALALEPCMFSNLACVARRLRFDADYCPVCGDSFLRNIFADRIQIPLIASSNTSSRVHGVIWGPSVFPGQALRLPTAVQQGLVERSFIWAADVGAPRAGEIDAIALPDRTHSTGALLRMSTSSSISMTMEPLNISAVASISTAPAEGAESAALSDAGAGAGLFMSSGGYPIYSREMHGVFFVGAAITPPPGGPARYGIRFQVLNGISYEIYAPGDLTDEILAATITHPAVNPDEGFIWKVIRKRATGRIYFTVDEVQLYGSSGSSRVILSVELPGMPGGYPMYVLQPAWDSLDTVFLTVSDGATRRWGVLEAGGFLPCMNGACFAFREAYRRSDFGGQGYLFQGVYSEPNALVVPSVQPGPHPRVDRRGRHPLGVKPVVAAANVNAWMD